MHSSRNHIDTLLQHTGAAQLDPETESGPVAMPSMRTSTVRFANLAALDRAQRAKMTGERGVTYGRVGLQTHEAFEQMLCELEGGERAFLAPSGLAAISVVLLALLNSGDHVLAADSVYGPVRYLDKTILGRMGVPVTYSRATPDALQAALLPETRVLYLESPGSLLMEMLDLPALTAWAHERGLVVVADNTWGSGYVYRPLELGADVSVIAATKYLGGHSDLMMGGAVARDSDLCRRIGETHYALGYTVSADDVWLGLRGARTLGIRMRQCAANAMRICEFLSGRPEVLQIFHPAWPDDPGHALWQRDCTGSNGLMSVALDMDGARTRRLVDALTLFGIGYSWGGYESLVTVGDTGALAAHSYWARLGDERLRDDSVIRLHIGLEDPRDLIADLTQAFEISREE
ncbi:MAG: PLP-dependent aspartate aminotransferase family protein [Alcaligenaceae bacterium]|nr:PLP-dependent aspartate aminotransferase family protein [Alcaligenaceae bacterium]